MKKNVKKGNLKTRRRIRKTIACLFMATAIVVAALPVENTGKTTQAAVAGKTPVDLGHIYDNYLYYFDNTYQTAADGDYYFPVKRATSTTDFSTNLTTSLQASKDWADYNATTYENRTANSAKVTATITKGLLEWTYLYKDKVSGAGDPQGIIVGYNPSKVKGSVSIADTAYKDAWIITPGLRDAFISTLNTNLEKFEFSFTKQVASDYTEYKAKDATSVSLPNAVNTSTLVFSDNSSMYTGGVNLTSQVEPAGTDYATTASGGTAQLYKDWYASDVVFTITKPDASTLKSFYTNLTQYQSWYALIENYNTERTKVINQINSADTITSSIATDALTVQNMYAALSESLTLDTSDFNVESDNFYEYICFRLKIDSSTTNTHINLNDYTLARVTDRIHFKSSTSTTFYSYVPILKDGKTTKNTIDENADGNKYLMVGTISIGGIGNKVFYDDTTINGELTLADTISFIGESAFEGTNLTSVSIQSVVKIGRRAFYTCSQLNTLNLADASGGSSVKYIGNQAFQNTALTSLSIPNSVTDIMPGAFAYCSALKDISFNITNDLYIWPFAFFNAAALESYTFPSANTYSKSIKIGLGAFALSSSGNGGALTEFVFPYMKDNIICGDVVFEKSSGDFYDACKTYVNNTTIGTHDISIAQLGKNYEKNNQSEFIYNFILGGRSKLTHVTFPANMGGSMSSSDANYAHIPDDTLYKCESLEYVTMGSCDVNTDTNQDCVGISYDVPEPDTSILTDNTKDSEYDLDEDEHTLFQDVTTENFYVEGPGLYSDSTKAHPRTTTWLAQTNKSNVVPYKFYYKDSKGVSHVCMEVSDGNFITNFIVNDEGTADLVSYKLIKTGDTSKLGEVVIPSSVCGYTITSTKEGCFEDIKTQVQELIIEDGCAISIEDEAFKDCTDLRKVYIGNSVVSIGKNAFKGCTKLENVYFNQPVSVTTDSSAEDWEKALTIEEDAFLTNSKFLTFHGVVHSGYQPFEYAMTTTNLVGSGNKNICYKTDEPTNLTVMVDQVTGKATLLDYPHYEDVDVQNPNTMAEQQETYKTINKYSILSDWENSYGLNSGTNHEAHKITTTNDKVTAAIENTLMMNIPDGIESIDVASYIKANENQYNLTYFPIYYYYNETDDSAGNKENIVYKVNGKFYSTSRGEDDDYKLRNINDNVSATGNIQKVVELYSKKQTDDTEVYLHSKEAAVNAGLFSGYFKDDDIKNYYTKIITETATIGGVSYNAGDISQEDKAPDKYGLIGASLTFNKSSRKIKRSKMLEEVVTGNDDLLTISFKSLTDLPDYAFYSCENLLYVDLGKDFGKDMGETVILPFAGCGALNGIEFEGETSNDYFTYANGILYRNLGDDKYEIVQVLESRGSTSSLDYEYDIAKTTINTKNDPLLSKVTSIAYGAFRNNTNITEVDLSDSKITKIPDYCFYGDTQLSLIEFPDTLESVGDYAFIGCTTRKQIYFNSPYVIIKESAFDKDSSATFHGDAYSDSEHTHRSTIWSYADERSYIDFEEISNYRIKLYNYNADLLAVRTVQVDESALVGGSIDDKTLQELEDSKCVRTGYTFTGWAWDKDGNLDTVDDVIIDQDEVLNDIKEDRVLVAQYKANSVVSDGKSYTLTVENGIILTTGESTGSILSGSAVAIIANTPSTGYTFNRWSSKEIDLDDDTRFNSKLTFIMPTKDAVITANYGDGNGNSTSGNGSNTGNTDNNGSSNNNNSSTDSTTKYTLTVNYGTGSGSYSAGEVVTITAYAPESSTKVFSKWTAGTTNIAFNNATSASTTIVMPASSEIVTANYKTRSSDDDDDDDSSSSSSNRRNQNTTTTTNVTTTTGNVNNAGTTTVPVDNGGDKLYINKNGVSNTDVGSTNVEGSSDNFIVRITDSDEATAAAQEALRNRFGSLDGIVYFPMDISLYDSTGNYKITDTYGLNVNVTMPIPDALIQYGGNVQIAAADNGYLQVINEKFTTIDGIACMSFTPPHFSPYVIFVDTNNLIAGLTYDQTPQTGDPIHPKWFLAAGFACLSIFLFVTGDRKKKIPVRA